MLLFLIDRKIRESEYYKIQELLENSPSYQLLKELLVKKHLNSTFFCNKYYLSRATFQRRKNKLNILLEHFSINFTKKSLQGEEKNIRWFLIQFFQSIAPFDLINNFFTAEEWAIFKECKQSLIKKLNHNLNKCFEIWLIAIFFYSIKFKKANKALKSCETDAFNQAFPFIKANDLEFLILGYRLLHPEQAEKFSSKTSIHPEAEIFVKNLNKSLPLFLNENLKRNLAINLTHFINLYQFLPIKFKSFTAERYLEDFCQKNLHKANFNHLLQEKLINNTSILKNSFKQNDYTRYFLNQLIDNVLFESKLPLYFQFYSDFDPYIQKNLKIRLYSICSQLVETQTKDLVDLTIYQSNCARHQPFTFYFPSFVTKDIWCQFAEKIKKIYYQKWSKWLIKEKSA
ncbi:MAG: helix-turn-helix domain-containing protein [Lactobacillales bacterium]|jgi:hypothetical protein|nr:helix-turn-helix domain-containing protein [Lactobacillales bacterium]